MHFRSDGWGSARCWSGQVLPVIWPTTVTSHCNTQVRFKHPGPVLTTGVHGLSNASHRINYPYRVVYVRYIGTHKQYDGIDAQTV